MAFNAAVLEDCEKNSPVSLYHTQELIHIAAGGFLKCAEYIDGKMKQSEHIFWLKFSLIYLHNILYLVS